MGRACSTNGEKRNSYRIFIGKSEETTRQTKIILIWILET
jgi:hypothetical protein